MRAEMALGLSSMKVFGFSEDKSEEQGLVMRGSVNIAFAWDSIDVMNIEYRIPLSFLEASSSLDQKDIRIGWKVNGFQFSSIHSGESSAGGGRHGGGGGYGGGAKEVVEEAMAATGILILNRALRIWRKIRVFGGSIPSKDNQ
jgi:hypothetical protein